MFKQLKIELISINAFGFAIGHSTAGVYEYDQPPTQPASRFGGRRRASPIRIVGTRSIGQAFRNVYCTLGNQLFLPVTSVISLHRSGKVLFCGTSRKLTPLSAILQSVSLVSRKPHHN